MTLDITTVFHFADQDWMYDLSTKIQYVVVSQYFYNYAMIHVQTSVWMGS